MEIESKNLEERLEDESDRAGEDQGRHDFQPNGAGIKSRKFLRCLPRLFIRHAGRFKGLVCS